MCSTTNTAAFSPAGSRQCRRDNLQRFHTARRRSDYDDVVFGHNGATLYSGLTADITGTTSR
jgi:hypothetical protein